VTSPELARFQQIVVLGYSLGGHVALRFAVETMDPRVRAVVAVCSPLMLAPGARAIDGPSGWPYRRYLLANLLECYERVAARKPVPTPVAEVRRLRKIERSHRATALPMPRTTMRRRVSARFWNDSPGRPCWWPRRPTR
jgi:pimeloyl-ACP methyl ester carboxylesterase